MLGDKAQGKDQHAASTVEIDKLQESAPEICLCNPKLGGLQILAISTGAWWQNQKPIQRGRPLFFFS